MDFVPDLFNWKCVKKGSYNSQYEQGWRNDYSKQDLFQSSYGFKTALKTCEPIL